jgi:hypothetical protein
MTTDLLAMAKAELTQAVKREKTTPWVPEKAGDYIVGTIDSVVDFESRSKFRSGQMDRAIVVNCEDGKVGAAKVTGQLLVWGDGKILRDEFAKAVKGARVAVIYGGLVKTANGQRSFKKYAVKYEFSA